MCQLIEIRDSVRFLDITESANRASDHPLTPLGKGRDMRGTNKWRRVRGGFTNHPAGKISDSRGSLPGFCVGLSLGWLGDRHCGADPVLQSPHLESKGGGGNASWM